MELFKLLGTVAIDGSAAEKSIEGIQNKAKGLGTTLETAGGKVGKFGTGLSKTLTVAGTAIGGLAIKSALSFEDSMANINTLLDDDSHLKGYEGAIKDLSNETGISLGVVSDGMYQTISSIGDGGESTERMFAIMGKSAKAGGADVSDSVALISAGMKGYNQVNEETAQKISDLGFQTAKLGVTTFPELAKSMQPLFPLSSGLGLSYEELFGVMATGTGVTGNTAEVTTQFKAVLSNLMSPTKSMTDLIGKYGYSNAQAMLQSEGLSGVLKIVQTETGGQADKMAELFSSTEAVTLMTALTGAQFDNFNLKLGEMQEATGATDTAYEKLNTNGDKIRRTWNELKNTATELGGTIIETFGPVIQQACEKVSEFCTWFQNLDDRTKKIIITIGGIVIAAGPVLTIVGKTMTGIGGIIKIGGSLIGGIGKIPGLISSVVSGGGKLISVVSSVISSGGKVITGIGSLVGKVAGVLLPAIGSVGAPVLIVIAVIGSLIAIGVALYKNWDEIKAFGIQAWEAIKTVVGNAVDGIKNFLSGVVDFIGNNWQGLLLLLVNPFVGGFKLLYDNCESFRNFIDGFVEKIKTAFGNLVSGVAEKFGNLKEAVVSKVTELRDNAVEKFNELKDGAIEKATELRDKAIEKYGEIKDKAVEKINDLKESTIERFNDLKEKTVERITEMRDKVVDAVSELKEKTAEKFEELTSKASEKVQELKDNMVQKFTELKEKSLEKIGDLKEKTVQKFGEIKEGAVQKVNDLKEKIVDRFVTLRDEAAAKISDLKDKAISGFMDMKGKATTAVDSLRENVIEKFSDMGSKASEKFKEIAGSITEIFEKAKEKLSGIVDAVKGFFDFDWKLPDIKVPRFDIKGTKEVFGLQLPNIDVSWHAKGGVMTKPTAFGINPVSGKVMAGGEAGDEAIAPISVLQDYVRAAVAEENGETNQALSKICLLLENMLQNIAEIANLKVVLSTGETVGALAAPMSGEIAKIITDRKRGR